MALSGLTSSRLPYLALQRSFRLSLMLYLLELREQYVLVKISGYLGVEYCCDINSGLRVSCWPQEARKDYQP